MISVMLRPALSAEAPKKMQFASFHAVLAGKCSGMFLSLAKNCNSLRFKKHSSSSFRITRLFKVVKDLLQQRN